jgi:adenine phosphoribosyltransferase
MKDFDLDAVIRKIPDFPKKGILFYDVTSILTNPEAFKWVIDKEEELYKNKKIDLILAAESRGFIFGAPLAYKLGIPLVLARKKGKLPGKTINQSYALEYGEASLEIQTDDIGSGKNVLIIDDLIATGGTLKACSEMIERLGSSIVGIFGVIGLPFLNYQEKIGKYGVITLVDYHGE